MGVEEQEGGGHAVEHGVEGGGPDGLVAEAVRVQAPAAEPGAGREAAYVGGECRAYLLQVGAARPVMAIYATDILLRRFRYDGRALTDETSGSPFWYAGGVNPARALALAAGVCAAALCVNTLYTGPIASVLGGIDLSLPAGMVVSATLYAALMRPLRPEE